MNDYKITIKSVTDGQVNEVITYGTMSEEYGLPKVEYFDEETGSKNKIVFSDGIISIVREGEISSVMTFEKGNNTEGEIVTPYGTIPVTFQTDVAESSKRDDGYSICLDYNTDLGGEVSRFNVNISIDRVR